MNEEQNKIIEESHKRILEELGLEEGPDGKLREKAGKPPVNSHNRYAHMSRFPRHKLPFRIPVIEKTTRQAQSTQGYKASAHWQTAMLLHDLINLWTPTLPPMPSQEGRKREQVESAIWSVVSNIEEGWARPSTKEYLDFLGFSQASLAEVRGGIERFATKSYLKTGSHGNLREIKGTRPVSHKSLYPPVNSHQSSSMEKLGIPTPSRNFPYPPVNSRKDPATYGKLRERLREYTGTNIRAEYLTYEIFIELINKTDYLIKKAVFGLQEKVIREEKEKFAGKVTSYWKPPKR